MQKEQTVQLQGSDSRRHRWAIILAGGDGTRLLPLTRRITGDDRPKQFCPVIGNETLLRQTQRRVSKLVPRWRTLLILTRVHERFYADHVAGMPSSSVLIQPCNRGTAPAILYSLMRLSEMDPNGTVAFFPADHYFSNDEAFVRQISSAYAIAALRPEVVVLLGIKPETAETDYGWIEPGAPLGNAASDSVCRVSRFWEKPNREVALTLLQSGCLWNSFVMVGHVNAYLNLIQQTVPDLVNAFEAVRLSFFTASESAAVNEVYSRLHSISFSQYVLSAEATNLAVFPGSDLGWTDLGEPNRVLSLLEVKGVPADREVTPGGWRAAAAQATGTAARHTFASSVLTDED